MRYPSLTEMYDMEIKGRSKVIGILLISLLLFSPALAQKQTKGAFVLPHSMIQSFNAKPFEFTLTPEGRDSVASMDFTRYSFLQCRMLRIFIY